jgi:hypothetical protein
MFKIDKNELLAFLGSKIDIGKFDLKEEDLSNGNKYSSAITMAVKNHSYFFCKVFAKNQRRTFDFESSVFAPSFPSSKFESGYGENMQQIKERLTIWLEYHLNFFFEELIAPDLFNEYQNQQKLLNFEDIVFEETELFSIVEKKLIKERFDSVKVLIIDHYNPNSDQLKFIEERLNYLVDASDRLNKYDWKGLLVSTIFSIAINLTVDTEGGRFLFSLFKNFFNQILHLQP